MTPGPLFGTLALALLGLAAAALASLRRRHAAVLGRREAEIERLQERIWVLSEDSERYRGLAEAGGAAIVQRDAGGRITFANEGFARLVGRPLIALAGSAVAPRVVETGSVGFGPDGARIIEEAILPAECGATEPRWFAWIETPATGHDGGPELLRAGRDVTERVTAGRTLEEARGRAEAASVAKSRFLATVSHEFRTPLNGILGMTALMMQTAPSPEQATYLRAVEVSGRALLSLIDEILDFSKIEAGRVDLASAPFDPAALVEGVVELLGPRAQDKGLEIASLAPAGLPRLVLGDADRVRQILINLAGNAVKFTESGGVGVTVEAAGEDEGGGIALDVTDTGPGIPMERLPSLFEEFEQGDGSASRRHEGTGLGLAITRRLVERMGGTIDAESRVGLGTTFRVRLPLPVAEAAPRVRPAGRGAVLIAARSPFEAPFLCRRLAEAGFAARHVETAEDAREALVGNRFAAVIADRGLGDEAARAVAAAARASGAGRSLILLSPFDRRDFGAPQDSGFDGYLVKPVRARSLLAQLGGSDAAAPSRPAPIPARPRPAEGARVLLAEDNAINALLARKALERLGAEVVWARDGLEAVALAGAALATGPAFDLALLDIRMPGLDGLGAVRRIRAMEEGRGRLPVVALTANARPEDEAAARAAGFDGFLPKPLDLAALPGLFERRRAA